MRYRQQEMYFGKESQQRLQKKHVVIVGVGALGSVASELLCRAGVGKLTLIDRDYVEEHNLQRQSLYTERDIGAAKATAAAQHLHQINSTITLIPQVTDLSSENISFLNGDLVVDGTDNMETRFLINAFCRKNNIPWIYGSAIRDEGYVKAYLPKDDCFNCTFSQGSGYETCDTSGVINSVTHVIASMQVVEALKVLLGKKPEGCLLHVNIWEQMLEKITTQQKKMCTICRGDYSILEGREEKRMIKFCGSSHYQIRGKPLSLRALHQRLKGSVLHDFCLRHGPATFFADGRVLIKTKSEQEALQLYTSLVGH